MTHTSNRVAAAIGMMRQRLTTVDAVATIKMDDAVTIAFGEHFAYQQAQATAHATGTLTSGEALVVYGALGPLYTDTNGGWAPGTDLATKVVVTQLVSELVR